MSQTALSASRPALRPPPTKRVGVAFILTLLFGPLGLAYATVDGALVMIVASIGLALVAQGLSLLVIWPACIVWGCKAARAHNWKMRFVYAG